MVDTQVRAFPEVVAGPAAGVGERVVRFPHVQTFLGLLSYRRLPSIPSPGGHAMPPGEAVQPASAYDLHNQIAALKKKIAARFEDHQVPYTHTHLHMVLSVLQKAELLSRSRWYHKKRKLRAWYEMTKAELLLYRQDAFCRENLLGEAAWKRQAEMGHTVASQNGHGVTAHAETTVRLTRERTRLEGELDRVWHEVMLTQRQCPQINTMTAADWLKRGEKAFSQSEPDLPQVKYCLLRASGSLAKAQECVNWGWCGMAVIFLEVFYLLLVPALVIMSTLQSPAPVSEAMQAVVNFITVLNVPRYAHMWGFIGGVSWCLFNATYWTKHRLFDRHYVAWYFAHPWISSTLGGVAALIFIGGLNSLTGSKFDSSGSSQTPQVGASLVSLVSFFAGFSTHAIWGLLESLIAKLFQRPESARVFHEKSQKAAHDMGD